MPAAGERSTTRPSPRTDDARAYVGMLERDYDRRIEAAIPTADSLGDEFERFLRDQRPDGPDASDTGPGETGPDETGPRDTEPGV